MTIHFYINQSETYVIGKTLTPVITLTGTLRGETSIIEPIILIESVSMINANYAYIPDFNRYYYIKDVVSVRRGLWRVTMNVDVLESHKNAILNSDVILINTEDINRDNYLSSDVWKAKVKELTDIIQFPQGLNSNGEYILITAGG